MPQVHILTGPERRRSWSDEQKRAIVAAAFASGAVVSRVARQADVSSGLIYRWRHELRAAVPGFAEVVVPSGTAVSSDAVASAIEVALSDGTRVHIPATIRPDLASAVLTALVGR